MATLTPLVGHPAAGSEGDAGGAEATAGAPPVAFVDASAIVAMVDADDPSHGAAVAAYRGLVADGYRLFTTDHGLAEAYDLLRLGLGGEVARRWLGLQRLAVYHVGEADLAEAERRLLAPAGEGGLPPDLSLTDALSLVVMERLGVADAFAVDPRFLAGAG